MVSSTGAQILRRPRATIEEPGAKLGLDLIKLKAGMETKEIA